MKCYEFSHYVLLNLLRYSIVLVASIYLDASPVRQSSRYYNDGNYFLSSSMPNYRVHGQRSGVYKCQFFVHSNYLDINLEENHYGCFSSLLIFRHSLNMMRLIEKFRIRMIGSPGIVFWRATQWRKLIHGPFLPGSVCA